MARKKTEYVPIMSWEAAVSYMIKRGGLWIQAHEPEVWAMAPKECPKEPDPFLQFLFSCRHYVESDPYTRDMPYHEANMAKADMMALDGDYGPEHIDFEPVDLKLRREYLRLIMKHGHDFDIDAKR